MLSVRYVPTSSLKPYERNARTHSKAQIRKIAESIRGFGFTNPVLIDDQSTIIAGHGRVQAAKLIGLEQVPTIRLASLTPAQVRAYVIADNALAEKSGWSKEILKVELQNLVLDSEFDVSLTGFEVAEIDLILGEEDRSDVCDELPEDRPVVSEAGDVWYLGKHRILCGDVRDKLSVADLMQGRQADLVFTDPPYNVAIEGNRVR